MGWEPLCSTIYVKFDDPRAGYSLRDRKKALWSAEEMCTNYFLNKDVSLKKSKSTVVTER